MATFDVSKRAHAADHALGGVADLTEIIHDAVAALLRAGSNISFSYDDAGNTLTLNATAGTGGTTDAEVVRDTIGGALVGGTNIQVLVNDAADTITLSVVNLTKSSVGLGNVDNTADVDKPVSTAQASALAPKSVSEALVTHDGSTGGGTRPSGYFRVRWIGGTVRPTNMLTGDVWERDA